MGLFGFNKKDTETLISPSQSFGRLYLIDYENTSDTGLIGLSHLSKSDELVIFFGSNNNSISFNSLEMIHLAACHSTIEKCERSAKNYLDFRLVSYLGMRLGKEEFSSVVIVSNDMGYDAVVEFWSEQGVTICRQAAIDDSIKAPTAKKSPDKKPKIASKSADKKAPVKEKAAVKKSKDSSNKKTDRVAENTLKKDVEKVTADMTKTKAAITLEDKPKKKAEKAQKNEVDKKAEKAPEDEIDKKAEKAPEDKAQKKASKKKADKDKSNKKSEKASSEKEKERPEQKEPTNQSAKKTTLAESEKKKIRLAVKEMNLQPNQYSLVYSAFLDSNDLEDFHNSLARKMGPRGSEIYKLTKNIFSESTTKKAGI